jgi:hypothetical protein
MEVLRAEIGEAHKARSDLLKWKLALVAGLGTIGLGLTQEIGHPIVLIGIPLVCGYVDLLTRHLTLRIHVIGDFLRGRPQGRGDEELLAKEAFYRDYEAFVERNRSVFAFEDWALYLSSIVLSLGVAAYGALLLARESETSRPEEVALLIVGLTGALIAFAIDRSYRAKRGSIQ